MHVRNLEYPLPLKIGGPKPHIFDVFRRLRSLTVILMAYYFETKHDMHNREIALETAIGLLHRLKMS